MSRLQGLVFSLFLCLEIFYWLGRGTNFGIISLVFSYILANVVVSKGKFNVSHSAKYILLLSVGLISFSMTMSKKKWSTLSCEDIQALHQTINSPHLHHPMEERKSDNYQQLLHFGNT